MKVDANPLVMEAVFAARKAAIAMAEEKSKNTIAANASSGENPSPIVTDHMRAQGDSGGLVAPPGQSDIERIREIGMSAYVDEVKARKIAEIRKEILKAMNLTEEMLAQLPSSQREQIEKIIAMEIQKQMAAMNAVENDDKKKIGEPGPGYSPNQQSKIDVRTEVISRTTDIGPGIGVLLALQEAETANNANNKSEEGSKNTTNKSDEE